MRKILYSALLISLLASCSNKNNTDTNPKNDATMLTHSKTETTKDQEAIAVLTTALFAQTDNRNWEAVKNTMADSVYVDYTALGGDSGFKTPDEIVNGWQALLPGFERTVHQPHNFAIWVASDRATATLDAIATHYLETPGGDNFWTVFAGYDTEYILENGVWKLARIDLSLYDQDGNTGLPGIAMERVKNNQVASLKEESRASETVEKFFQALEAGNLDVFLETLAENIVQDMPFAPANFPEKLSGLDAMRKQYTGVMDYTQHYQREYFPTQDPHTVLVKFNGTITTSAGKPYNNSYVGIYTINDSGQISHFVENFNPNILLNGWPGLQPENYSVHKAAARTDSGVSLKEVSFNSNGVNLKGHLFLPPDFKDTQKYPAAIVTGSWTSVKEQMPDEYASLLALDGFISLTFDFTGFGESEGQPRQMEDHKLKIADIKAAVDFLSSNKNVDMERLSGLGICASAGYMAHATARDERMRNLVLVAPWLHNPEIAGTIYDFRPGGTEGLLRAAREAKEQYAETGEMPYVLAASELDPLSAMYVPENVFDYYLNPAKAAGALYDNRFAVSSWEPWLTFDAISSASQINQPVFIVHSENGAVPQGARNFYEKLKGEKDIVWLNYYDQQQLYFEKDAVHAAIDRVVAYLKGV